MKTTGSPAPATMCAALLLIVACGCSQAGAIAGNAPAATSSTPTPPTTGASTVPSRAALLAFAARIGVTCDQASLQSCFTGKIEVGDYLDVELRPDCGTKGLYAVVSKPSAELRDRAAPLDRRTVAVIPAGQLLCVEAIGRAGDMPAYYYVRAQPRLPAGSCNDDKKCAPAGASGVHWVDPRRDDCTRSEQAAGQVHCAAGWIDADVVDLLADSK